MKIRIFLADDHPLIRDGLRLILGQQKDMTVVVEAADGRDAVEGAARLHPHIVLLDIAMPKLNGIEATSAILSVSPSTKVIILSMHSSTDHVFRALDAGAAGYLLKESVGREVVAAVRTVYGCGQYLSPSISEALTQDYVRRRKREDSGNPLCKLSPREREIFRLLVNGKSNKEIAYQLSISSKTVETYRSRMMEKLGIHDLPALVKLAIESGVTTLD